MKNKNERIEDNMPIAILALLFSPMFIALPMVISEGEKEQKVNEICVQKFNSPEKIKECKTILMKIQR